LLQNRPHLRTIALAVALCAMSTTVCNLSVQAKDGSCSKQTQNSDDSSSGANANYLLKALNKEGKKHKKCKKTSGSATVGFETIKSETKLNYKAGLGVGVGSGSNSTFVPGAKQDSKNDSKTSGGTGFGWGGMFGNNSGSSNNSSSNANSNSGSGSGSGSIGFGWGNMFGAGNGSSGNAAAGSNAGSANNSGSGFGGLGSLFGNNASNNSGSGNVSSNGVMVPSGSGSGSGTPIQLPPVSHSGNGSNNPNIPRINPLPVRPIPAGRLTDEYINGRQVDLDEYTRRLQRWAATGQTTVSPGGTATGTVRPNPAIIRRPILGGGAQTASASSSSGGGGGGSSAGAGAGFSAATSGMFMQQAWNAMNPKSAENDAAQQRQPDPTNPNDYYVSLPSADRTMRQVFVELVAGQDQKNKNCPGGECENKGQEGNYNQLKPQEPPQPITAGGYARAAEFKQQVMSQVGNSPEAAAGAAKAGMQSQCQGAGEAGAAGTVEGLEQALMVMFLPTSTINIANEAAGTPGSTLTPFRPLSQAIWMVQKMYKQVFMPIAILLLLPGALILNLKVMIQAGINKGSHEDTTSPFSAIMRSMIAVFLIPATQLIVSYASDIGSAMTHEVSGATKVMALVAWAKTAMGESMTPLNGEATGTSNMQAGKAIFAAVMNTVAMTLAYGLLMLIAFQITIMCYLMCMGPIAAAFYVYPTGVGRLFKPVFANWVDAVINIALWKFWWCVIVLCMVTRINLMTFVDINPEWEAYMFVCFLVMMSYVPFCPFECKPGEMVDKILQKAQELKKSAGDQNG